MSKTYRIFSKFIIYALAALVAFVSSFPLIWMISSALKPYEESFSIPPTLLPKAPTFGNFVELFQVTNFGKYFINSTFIAVGATIIAVILSAMSGYALSRSDSWLSKWFGRFVLFTYIFPPILMLIPLYMLVTKLGLMDSRVGLMLIYITFTLPFTIWLIRAFFDAIPLSLEEAAIVDGASSFQVYWKIVLPMVRPGIISTAIFAFIEAWNEYLYAVVFISSDSKKNLAAGISS